MIKFRLQGVCQCGRPKKRNPGIFSKKQLGFSLFRVTNPGEFQKYPKVTGEFGDNEVEFHNPDEIMKECRSVIVLGMESKTDIFDCVILNETIRAQFYHEIIHHRLGLLKEYIEKKGYAAVIAEEISCSISRTGPDRGKFSGN